MFNLWDLLFSVNSALGFLNFYILQWFFVRLVKIIDTDTNRIIKWGIMYWVFPLTGWDEKKYKFIGESKYLFINGKKNVIQ